MAEPQVLELGHLPEYDISNQAPLWLGQLLLCLIEGSMFCMLIAIYFYLRLSVDVWPPPGSQLWSIWVPSVAIIPLALSALGSYAASLGAKQNNRLLMIVGMLGNLLLAALFLFFRYLEWRSFNFNWQADAHATIVWTILFLHTFDVVADLMMTLVLLIIISTGTYGPKQRIGVHVDSVVWYFLVAIWLPLYAVIYWGPRLVGAQ
jgi:heme/copper-type cytochrome/quinol oxidase subunit 3